MDSQAICQRTVKLHAKRRCRVGIGNKRLYLRDRQPKLAHESKGPILIELMPLMVTPINKGPEPALLRGDFAEDGRCLARFVTRYSVQRPMAKDHLHVIGMSGLIVHQRTVSRRTYRTRV